MTFKQLQDMTLDLCQEIASSPDFSLTRLKFYLNRANEDFVRQTDCLQAEIDITTVANQVSYATADAANLAFVKRVFEVRYDNGTERGNKLKLINHSELPERYEYGLPAFYWVTGNNSRGIAGATTGTFKIGTHPIVSEAQTIRVNAFIFPVADMSANSDVPAMQVAWQTALPEYVAYRLFGLYSHKNPAYGRKSQDHFAVYQNMVNDFNFNAVQDSAETTEVVDVY